MDQETEEQPVYTHITQNDFSYRKYKKQKEEDIWICVCKFVATNPDNACGDRCLNSLTSTECTPGYCPCGDHCKKQVYYRTLWRSNILKRGRAKVSSVRDSRFMRCIYYYLDAHESIDATRKGSLGRFVNHSCQPNCETRKWTVLGEIRAGIFAKQDIPVGTELAYDYNFEWYAVAKVRCLCGAASCSGFLGTKSCGFLEDTYVWEDDDERYSVEKVPLYDSTEDEHSFKFTDNMDMPKHEYSYTYCITSRSKPEASAPV